MKFGDIITVANRPPDSSVTFLIMRNVNLSDYIALYNKLTRAFSPGVPAISGLSDSGFVSGDARVRHYLKGSEYPMDPVYFSVPMSPVATRRFNAIRDDMTKTA